MTGRPAEPHAGETMFLCGMPIENVTLSEALARIDERIASGAGGYVVTPNVDHVCRFHRDPRFRRSCEESFLRLADGTPLIWASRLFGDPIKEKLSGSDLVYWLAEHAAARGHSLFLLGAAEGVADAAAEKLQALYPGLRIAGTYSPPMGFDRDPATGAETQRLVKDSGAKLCYVALGAPKQEFWMQSAARIPGMPVMLGIGASLDFIAGRARRAPLILQKAGLEWFWRLCMEPRRLWRRYLIDDSYFLVLLFREALSIRARRAGR